LLRNLVAGPTPIDRSVVRWVEFSTELLDQFGIVPLRAPCIEIGHRQIHHATVTPEPRGMKRQTLRQEPKLRRHRAEPLIRVEIEEGEKELSPGCRSAWSPPRMKKVARAPGGLIVHPYPQEAQCHIVGARTVDARGPFDVKPKTTVCVLMSANVALHLFAIIIRQSVTNDRTGRDVERQEKEGATIISVPRSIFVLATYKPIEPLLQAHLSSKSAVVPHCLTHRSDGPGRTTGLESLIGSSQGLVVTTIATTISNDASHILATDLHFTARLKDC